VTEKSTVVVHISGQRYAIKTDADETYLLELASYVEERLAQAQKASKGGSSFKKAILAALNIADELYRERKKTKELKTKVLWKSRKILSFLEKEALSSTEP
jgi:cell division protein ZapA